MDSISEQNPGPGSSGGREEPATNDLIKKIREMDCEELLTWIQQEDPKLLKGEDLENFRKERINGDFFLDYGDDWEFFKEGCNLPAGTSDGLAILANEVIGKVTIGTKSKPYSHLYHGRHADSQLTVSQGTANRLGLQSSLRRLLKEGTQTAKLLSYCGNSPNLPVSEGTRFGRYL
jgi:hypothetical protein